MNCDQAFECITDPTVVGDDALDAHLQNCPRCRDMAEILEPALRFVNGQSEQSWSEAELGFSPSDRGPSHETVSLTTGRLGGGGSCGGFDSQKNTPRKNDSQPLAGVGRYDADGCLGVVRCQSH